MRFIRALRAGAGMLMLAAPAFAQQLSYSGWLAPTHVLTSEMSVAWADSVRAASNGEIDFEVFTGGALLPALSTMQGIKDGVAQAGHVAALYHPSEFPIGNLVGDLGHEDPDPYVLSFAYLDFSMNDEAAYAEWHRAGIIPGGTVSTPLNRYLCRDVIETADDLRGARIRTPGGGWARFAEYLGGTPVNIPANEIYTALERGAVECLLTDVTQLTSGATVMDLVDSVVMLPFSPGFNAAHVTYNPDFWKGLRSDQRRLLLDQTALAMARTLIAFDQKTAEAIEAGKAAGIRFDDPDESLTTAYAAWIEDDFGGVSEVAREQLGIADPEPIKAEFRGYLDKWTKLMEGVDRSDAEAVAAVIKTNLFDQIDVDVYGME